MNDHEEKKMLHVHIILGANDHAKIRTNESLRVGKTGDTVAELTRREWSLISPR